MSEQEKIREKENKQKTTAIRPGYFEVMILALFISCLALYGYDRYFAQKIKVVDLKGYLRGQGALLATGDMTKEQWQAGLDRVEQALNREAADGNTIIVLKEVVLRNGKEIQLR
jgi:hypothetical protein